MTRLQTMYRPTAGALLFALAAILPGCSSDSNGDEPPGDELPITDGTWYRPTIESTWQFQIRGQLLTETHSDVYVVDLFNTPASEIAVLQTVGRRVLCHFPAGTYDTSAPDAAGFDTADLGNAVVGDEKSRWLNIRSEAVFVKIAERVELAREKGCDGVVPDRVDAYLVDNGFTTTATHQRTFDRRLANEAHRNRLAVGLKNMRQLIPDLVEYFDFALVERCHELGTCSSEAPFLSASKPVFSAEYDALYATDEAARAALCAAAAADGRRALVLPPELDGSYRFSCDG